MLKISKILTKCLKNGNRQNIIGRYNNFSASVAVTEAKNTSETTNNNNIEERNRSNENIRRSNMVAAAFASLHSENTNAIKTPQTDHKILKAKTVDELLVISEGSGVSRRHALKVVSVLAEWSSSGKVNLSDFETDSRFIKLCRILTKGNNKSRNISAQSDDLSTILSVTADDEAAKLVANITVPQMVKVMSTLALKKRRSTPLLRALAYNITGSSDKLDIKQSADVLYSMCMLNFTEENLIAKVSSDICISLKDDIKRSSVVGSIITSLGLLKYKNPEVLDSLSEWILKNHNICRAQDIFSWFITLGAVNYLPGNSDQLFKELLPQLSISDARKPLVWLDLIWSLVLLNKATPEQVSDVLQESFISKLKGSKSLTLSTKLKLLNINGAAEYSLTNYNGCRLSPDSSIYNIDIKRGKEKNELVEAVIDSLRNLLSPDSMKTNVETNLGFYIDAKFLLDQKCHAVPFTLNNESRSDITRVAVIIYDFHDMCKGKIEPTGVNIFVTQLLRLQGYKILEVPYTEFHIKDKLIHRVQYLESKLKDLVKNL